MAVGKGTRSVLLAVVAMRVPPTEGGIADLRVAVGVLEGRVVAALAPDSEITGIRVDWVKGALATSMGVPRDGDAGAGRDAEIARAAQK